MHNKFGIVLPWKLRSAELETVQRLKKAADNLNIGCEIIDRKGLVLGPEHLEQIQTRSPGTYAQNPINISPNNKPNYSEMDFILQPHSVLAKKQDIFSFGFLCVAMEHLFDHGYQESTANLLTHDDFLSWEADACDDHMTRSLQTDPLHLPPPGIQMNAPVCQPVIPPVAKKRRLFYIAAGWDHERHKSLLTALDQNNLIELYGSKEHSDWSEYRNYHGELPFDAQGVVNKIAEVGATLAISAEIHIRAGLMTNRLFEGLAAGSVVICDEHPFGLRHFGDTLLYVDSRKPDLYGQVKKHMDWMNENPEEARDMAARAQAIFVEKFSAESCLKNIYERLEERKKALRFGLDPEASDNPNVRIMYLLLDDTEQSRRHFKESIQTQDYANIRITTVMDASLNIEKDILQLAGDRADHIDFLKIENLADKSIHHMGAIFTEMLRYLKERKDFDFFNLITSSENIFSNHISSLIRIMRRNPDKDVAATAEVFDRPEWPSDDFPQHWDIEKCYKPQNSVDFSHDLSFFTTGSARFLFTKKALANIRLDLLPYLNRKAIVALLHPQSIAGSGLATVASSIEHPFFQQAPTHDEDLMIGQVYPDYLRLHSPIQTLQEKVAAAKELLNAKHQIEGRLAEIENRQMQHLKHQKRTLRKYLQRQNMTGLVLLILAGVTLLHLFVA